MDPPPSIDAEQQIPEGGNAPNDPNEFVCCGRAAIRLPTGALKHP